MHENVEPTEPGYDRLDGIVGAWSFREIGGERDEIWLRKVLRGDRPGGTDNSCTGRKKSLSDERSKATLGSRNQNKLVFH